MITHETEVLVTGMGPVAALALARQGVDVAAVEANGAGSVDLRASTFHAPTIDILHRLGAAETLFGHGLKAPVYQYQYRDRQSGEVFAFDLGEIADRTAFPYRIPVLHSVRATPCHGSASPVPACCRASACSSSSRTPPA